MNQATLTRHDTPKWLVIWCLPHVGVMNLKSTPPPTHRAWWPDANAPHHRDVNLFVGGHRLGATHVAGLVTSVSPTGKIPRKDGTWKSWKNPCSSANVWVKWIDDKWYRFTHFGARNQKVECIPLMLHGAGIFTYKTGWFCSGKCWDSYSSTMGRIWLSDDQPGGPYKPGFSYHNS